MEEHADKEGPKRKLLAPLGELHLDVVQGPMSIMSWNCRVLGNPWSVQALKRVIRKEGPNLVFLMETKLEKKDMKKVQEEIGILQGIAVSSVGRRGGLALLWKPDMNVSIRFLNRWYIDALVDSKDEIREWLYVEVMRKFCPTSIADVVSK
uniref:Uncharacterized protein n=1 Tax=Quercus lobata TaxID=97700 RepID=A0A7N2MZT8_QUELO